MHNPSHPGELLRQIFIDAKLNIVGAAKKLEMPSSTLRDVILGKTKIKAKLAIKLAKLFNTTPENWLIPQMQYDLWQEISKEETKSSLMQPPE